MRKSLTAQLEVLKSRLSEEAWAARFEQARQDAKVLDGILKRAANGKGLNKAIRKMVPEERRSWVMRHLPSYRQDGVGALIDKRLPREPRIAKECGGLIEAARSANPRLKEEEMLKILRKQKIRFLPSFATIKHHFAKADRRRKNEEKKVRMAKEVVELPFAGGELLRAAELEAGAIAALTNEVMAMGEEAVKASEGQTPVKDVAHRDRNGHFTATYNQKRKRKRGEKVASYLRSAAEKAEGRVPSWARFVHENRETIEPKLWMLTLAPFVSGTKGWDALRAPEAAGLAPLTGFAYMPSTLAKLTSALAISSAGPRLLEAVGRNWHQVSQQRWGETGAMAALYIDNHAKEVWSSLYTQSGKVSHLNRVMPCITTTYVHTGAGSPLVASVQSGAAPLAPRLLELVKNAEMTLGGEVRRATVIDAEGSTFDVLEAFAKEGRVIVTPLRPARAPELELQYSRGSYFRPYRENDELRVATAVLTHKSTGRSLELGVLLVRREHRANDTVLLTTGLALGLDGRDLADLYFARWPIQENAFKDGTAVALDEHRGNCGRMVANVAVMSELEGLERRAKADAEKRQRLLAESTAREETLEQAQREHQRATRALETRQRRLDTLIAEGRTEGRQLGRMAIEHREALSRAEAAQTVLVKVEQDCKRQGVQLAELNTRLKQAEAHREKLQPQQAIRQLDVALDTILTATKLTAALLISFVLREYLPAMRMTPHTFISRVFSLRGHREVSGEVERTIFYENPRDPEVNAALRTACRKLNQRKLRRRGKLLLYSIEHP